MAYYDYYDYGFTPDAFDAGASEAISGALGAFLGFFLVFYLLMIAFGIVSYVLQSVGMYTIAKRRGIHNPWLAWVPVGNMWILGSISDQYQYVAKGRVRNRRKVLMGLTVAMLLLSVITCVSAFVGAFTEAAGMDTGEVLFGASLGVVLVTYLVIAVISIVAVVIQYMALYDLYVSCEPSNGVLYLVLSIFVSVAMPFFVFACRKKDLGMPPRKEPKQDIPVVEAIVETPADTAEE